MWHVLVRGEVLVGKPERKTTLERRGRRWKDNIETDFTGTAWGDLD